MVDEGHVFDLIPAYALDCLDEGDLQVVEAHLVGCARCRDELQAYQEVAGQIAFAVPQAEPPARLKADLIGRLQASEETREASQLPAVGATRAVKTRPGWWQFWVGTLSPRSPGWALAGLALVVVLGISNLLLWQQVRDLRAVQADTLRTVALTGTQFAPEATGLIVISKNGEHGTLVVDRLPQLDPEHEYQLWLTDGDQRTSGGVFSVDEDGYKGLWVGSPQPLDSYSSYGVTIEPAGGSPGPTGEKVLGGDL
jgi:anti-sigma-K factor RskA